MNKKKINTIKREKTYDFFLSLLLSISTVCMTRIHFIGSVWGTKDENYIEDFGISAIVLGIVLFFIFQIFVFFLDASIQHFLEKKASFDQREKDHKKIICFWYIIIFFAWLPYYLSYYPGGVYADTFSSVSYVYAGVHTNRHPFLYTELIGVFIKGGAMLGKDLTWSIGAFTAIQVLVLECEFIYFVYWMLKRKIHIYVRIFSSIFFVFFPLIPLYAISVWKDTPFCGAVLLWMMFIVDLYFNIENGEFNIKTILGFGCGAFLVSFTRNNGIYVVILSVIILIIMSIKRLNKEQNLMNVSIVCSIIIITILFIQGPLYNIMGVSQTETVENFGIPLQQIGAVVANDGNITEEQKDIINHFIPYENIKEHYTPALVDGLKWFAGMDGNYLSEHKIEFFEIWIKLFRQNPLIYIQAYLMATLGFWNVDISTSDAYVQNFVWDNNYGIEQKDYFLKWFDFSFQHFVNPRKFISCAWLFWIFFLVVWYSMKHYGEKTIFLFVPQLGVWATLMIATPIAVSLRYIASSLFTLPFVLIVPMLLERKIQKMV